MGCGRFFYRKRLQFDSRNAANWLVAEPSNYDPFLFAPVLNGMWRQHEVWDGTYTLSDLLDAHEMMTVRAENERRAREQQDMEQQMKMR